MNIITGDWWEGISDEAFMAWLNVIWLYGLLKAMTILQNVNHFLGPDSNKVILDADQLTLPRF